MRTAARVLAALLALADVGCAARGELVDQDSPLRPVTDLYARNAIVSIPTLFGNAIGAVVGLPFFVVFRAIDHFGSAGETGSSHWADRAATMSLMIPGVAVGAVTGAPFVPFALLAPEDPIGTPVLVIPNIS